MKVIKYLNYVSDYKYSLLFDYYAIDIFNDYKLTSEFIISYETYTVEFDEE